MEQQFIGDNWQELLDAQEANLGAALFVVMRYSAEAYFNAVRIIGIENDSIAMELKTEKLDYLSDLRLPVEHLAGFFRHKHGYTQPPLPDTIGTPKDIEDDWLRWLMYEVEDWATEQPSLIRLICQIVTCADDRKRRTLIDQTVQVVAKSYPLPV